MNRATFYIDSKKDLFAIDGDTFAVFGKLRIRLAEIDTPERNTEEGKKATLFTSFCLAGEVVPFDRITFEPITFGRYGRLICKVRLGHFDLSVLVARNGWTKKTKWTRRRSVINAINKAKKEKLGIWRVK